MMIDDGQVYVEPISGTTGVIQKRSTQSGEELVRIQGHWYPAAACAPIVVPVDNVVDLNVITTLPLNPDRGLEKAVGKMDRVMVIGVTKDGEEYFASSEADGGTVLWDMERAKMKLLAIPEDMQ